MADENVSVTVADTHLHEFQAVIRRLERAGLTVEHGLENVGVVTGRVDSARVDSLRQIAGVADVERSRTVGIPPGETDS